MSTMKQDMFSNTAKLAAIALLAFTPAAAQAQDRIAVPLTDPSRPVTLRVGLITGGITVKGADVKEVVVEARVRAEDDSDDERRSKRGGMRRLPVNTTGLTVEEESNVVRVGSESHNQAVDITVTVPRQTSVRLRATNDGDIVVSGIEGELDVHNSNGNVTCTNVSGSVLAHSLNGDVKVSLVRSAGKPMAFSSLNGEIDVTLPADTKANVSFKAANGEVYSDFDVTVQPAAPQQITEGRDSSGKGKFRVKIDRSVRGTINGGGPEIQFTNHNGDIYIRKAGAPRSND